MSERSTEAQEGSQRSAVMLTLTREQAAYLYDEVAAADMEQVQKLSRYERGMIRMCIDVRGQLAAQGIEGVIAQQRSGPS